MQDKGRDASSAPDDDMSEGTWMTYADLAKLRRISSASAFKLALRHKWRRQKNNTGQIGAIPLTADGAIDVARADVEWLPWWRPMTPPNPYGPPPAPDATAQADAAMRHDLVNAGMPVEDVDALMGEMERMLQA